jgi:Bacterial SCP ortholog
MFGNVPKKLPSASSVPPPSSGARGTPFPAVGTALFPAGGTAPAPRTGPPSQCPAARRLAFSGVPPRQPDPARLLAALDEQRAALGQPPWDGPVTPPVLGRAAVAAVTEALDAGGQPLREAQRVAVRYLLEALAEQVPGRAVEVRVPPFAAVQCIEGPRHTRGTPPNVVETDPLTWLALATGRLDWAAALASGQLRASGPRADISAYLPLVRRLP